jgi:hypothetical protein
MKQEIYKKRFISAKVAISSRIQGAKGSRIRVNLNPQILFTAKWETFQKIFKGSRKGTLRIFRDTLWCINQLNLFEYQHDSKDLIYIKQIDRSICFV